MRQIRQTLQVLLVAVFIFPSTAKAGTPGNDSPDSERPFRFTIAAFDEKQTPSTPSPFEDKTIQPSIFSSLSIPPEPMNGGERFKFYLDCTFGLESLFRSAATAGIKQARNTIPEWEQGIDGYNARFASSVGRRMIKNSIHHGLSTLLKEDPRYYYSGRSGVWTRSLYAAGQTFVTHKNTGQSRFAYTRLLGTIGGIYISRQWYPENRQKFSECVTSFAISIGLDAAKNVFREFWPDIKSRVKK